MRVILYCLFTFFSFQVFDASAGTKKQPSKGTKKTAFTPNRQWELRLRERLRSGQEVRMLAPVSEENVTGSKVKFSWERNQEKGKLFLGILSNENMEVFYREVFDSQALIDTKENNLKPGLYYWVLESEQDVLAVGKFYFRK